MKHEYRKRRELIKALSLRSLFLFPFSIVKAHYEHSNIRRTPGHCEFIQLDEKDAFHIFEGNDWERLELYPKQYKTVEPNETIHIVTRDGYLEKELLNSIYFDR